LKESEASCRACAIGRHCRKPHLVIEILGAAELIRGCPRSPMRYRSD
jgi:hypothetical protein